MPHIRVQMYPGRDESTKEKLTQSLCECLQNVLASDEKASLFPLKKWLQKTGMKK